MKSLAPATCGISVGHGRESDADDGDGEAHGDEDGGGTMLLLPERHVGNEARRLLDGGVQVGGCGGGSGGGDGGGGKANGGLTARV